MTPPPSPSEKISSKSPVLLGLSKLSDVVKNEVVKKTEYNAKTKNIVHKIPYITKLAAKTILNTQINEVKAEIPSINNLDTTTAVTAVENKIPDVVNLVNEIGKKITDHSHDKYITTPELNKLTAENFAARLAQANLVTKTNFDNKLIKRNKMITSSKTKNLIVENEFKKLEIFDPIYFRVKSHFENDGAQNYLVFQTASRSKGLADESIKPPSKKCLILH